MLTYPFPHKKEEAEAKKDVQRRDALHHALNDRFACMDY
jgi:hypothetical protein